MTVPTVRAVGTPDGNTTPAVPGLPAGIVAGDLLLMFVETEDAAVTVSGWTEAPSSPQSRNDGGALISRLTIFYKIAVGSDATTTSDSGNHQIARIIGITQGTFDATTPFNTSGGNTQGGTTSVSITGVTTTRNDCLIVAATAGSLPDSTSTTEFSSWADASLTNIVEQIDNTDGAGNGGAIGVATGSLATAGASGTITVTAVTSAVRENICLAVQPPAAATDFVGFIPIF